MWYGSRLVSGHRMIMVIAKRWMLFTASLIFSNYSTLFVIGDPFVFGRGGEEVLEFRSFGVEPSVIPVSRHVVYSFLIKTTILLRIRISHDVRHIFFATKTTNGIISAQLFSGSIGCIFCSPSCINSGYPPRYLKPGGYVYWLRTRQHIT